MRGASPAATPPWLRVSPVMRHLSSYNSIKSVNRHVRTRLYFTSESHVHSILNALRFVGNDLPGGSFLTDAAKNILSGVPELDYLTHIVFRMYENFKVPPGTPDRFRIEVLFSPGCSTSPYDIKTRTAVTRSGTFTAGYVPRTMPLKNAYVSTPALIGSHGEPGTPASVASSVASATSNASSLPGTAGQPAGTGAGGAGAGVAVAAGAVAGGIAANPPPHAGSGSDDTGRNPHGSSHPSSRPGIPPTAAKVASVRSCGHEDEGRWLLRIVHHAGSCVLKYDAGWPRAELLDMARLVHAVPATAISPLRTTVNLTQMRAMLVECIRAGTFPSSSDADSAPTDGEDESKGDAAQERAAAVSQARADQDAADAEAAETAAVADTKFLQMLEMDAANRAHEDDDADETAPPAALRGLGESKI